MTALYGLYRTPDEAQTVYDQLRAAGAASADIVVISSEPYEEFEFSHRDKATWLYWISGGGGAFGLAASYALTTLAAHAWPINTGGMPIVAPYPNAIILFEMTMLGAILATVVALFITAKLPNRGPRLYDREVSDGYILVGLERPAPALEGALRSALESVPGARIRTTGGA